LLDAGPDANLWQTNANKLGIQLKAIEAIVLSHYHWDHSGGLWGAIPAIQEPLVADLHSSQIVARGRPIPGDKVSMHKPANPSREELTELGAKVQIYDEEHTQCHDFFYVSGFIPRTTDFETGIPNHVSMVNGKWVLDELIADERYVACSIKNLGIVVFSSCSHAGIVNVCRDAMQKSGKPIFGVVGGFHLGGTQVEGRIPNTVEGLARVDPKIILAGHCTGWRAKARLAVDLADRYQPLAVGGTYVFRDSAPSSLR
jgi:7,8-dihydropterin-6-yl-methyl-4-(beta-D-ribofuranosyl)aminobenzene 5'-phosphate synthase